LRGTNRPFKTTLYYCSQKQSKRSLISFEHETKTFNLNLHAPSSRLQENIIGNKEEKRRDDAAMRDPEGDENRSVRKNRIRERKITFRKLEEEDIIEQENGNNKADAPNHSVIIIVTNFSKHSSKRGRKPQPFK
jgi:hypothetical protein